MGLLTFRSSFSRLLQALMLVGGSATLFVL